GGREAERKAEAARYVEAARNGIARDTRAAYAASADALRAALALDPGRDEAKALLALALARLAVDYGSGEADREEALRLAAEVGTEHAAILEARHLLAPSDEERAEVEEAIVRRAEVDPSASIQSLAGEILLRRGAPELAIDRFNAAMRAAPGHVPTLVRIADYYRSRREYAEALRYYDLALAVAEDHVNALLGAAESHLALRSEPQRLQGAWRLFRTHFRRNSPSPSPSASSAPAPPRAPLAGWHASTSRSTPTPGCGRRSSGSCSRATSLPRQPKCRRHLTSASFASC